MAASDVPLDVTECGLKYPLKELFQNTGGVPDANASTSV